MVIIKKRMISLIRVIPNRVFKFVLLFGVIILGSPIQTIAQSEEDVLNSIGAELESDSDKRKKQEKIDKEYNALKSKADSYYKSKRYDKAKEYYNQMLQLKPDSDFASGKLSSIDQKIAEAKAAEAEKNYQSIIKQADLLLASEKWNEAATKYAAALSARPDDPYPKSQLSKVKSLQLEAQKAKEAATLQKKYDGVLASAESLLAAKNWDAAKQKFLEASSIKPNETYPKEKAAQIVKLKAEAIALAKKKKLDKDYTTKLTSADELFAKREWEKSIVSYTSALELKPSEAYPNSQITKAKERIKTDLENKRKAEELETQYASLKTKGENALANKNWEEAINSFVTASSLKPKNTEILGLLKQSRSGKKTEDDLALKLKAEKEAADKLQKQYDRLIAEGSQKVSTKNWNEARQLFTKAKSLKPEDPITDAKISELDNLVKEEELAKEKELASIKAAEEAEKLRLAEEKRLAEENAEKARLQKIEEERLAAEAKAEEEAKKAEIERLRLEEVAKQKAEAEALAKLEAEKEEAEKNRLKEEARLAAVAAAELEVKRQEELKELERLEAEKLAAAKELQEENDRIEKAAKEKEIAQQQEEERLAEENRLLAEQQETERRTQGFKVALKTYKNAIKEGDWSMALQAINEAQVFYPENEEIDRMMVELTALKKAETAALSAETKKREELEKLENAYQETLKSGDIALSKNDFDLARSNYNEALKIKPNEDYPTNQLIKIKELRLAANQKELEKQKELDSRFSEKITEAELMATNKEWDNAIKLFKEAASIKSESDVPAIRIAEIQSLQKKEREVANQQAELDADYSNRMKNGQQFMDEKKFAEAKRFFFGASKLKPNETLPKEKLEELTKLWEEYNESQKEIVAQQKIKKDNELYESSIVNGDKSFKAELWSESMKYYKSALGVKQGDEYATEQFNKAKKLELESIEKNKALQAEKEAELLASQQAAKLLADEKARLAQVELAYTDAMENGNSAMNIKNYKKAVSSYKTALKAKPDDSKASNALLKAEELFEESEQIRLEKYAERKRLAKIELEKKRKVAEEKREAYLAELMKNSPEELAKKYPDGITEEIETEQELIITKSVIVEKGSGRYLIRFDYPWGEHFYYLNGKKIRADTYNWNIRKYKF